MRHAYFISDAHLGAHSKVPSQVREKRLIQLLSHIYETHKQEKAYIILLGDIWDFWFEWRHCIPAGFVRLMGTLALLTDSGFQVFFVPGNHDQWTFGYLERELGIKVVSDPWTFEYNSKKFFISHGHKIPPVPASEKLTNTLFESKVARKLFKLVHPDLGIWIAKKWSHTSRMHHPPEPPQEALERYEKFVEEMQSKTHYDFYVFAHLHYPIKKTIKGAIYVNTGDWLTHFTYAKFDGNTINLHKWGD